MMPSEDAPVGPSEPVEGPPMPMGGGFPSMNPETYMSAVQQLLAMIQGQQQQDHAALAQGQQQALEPALQALMAAVQGQPVGVAEGGMPPDVEDPEVEGEA